MLEMLGLRILEMSFEAVIVAGAVLLLRLAFRRLPKGYSCVLWLLVLFRLLCPVTVNSSVSLMPDSGIWQEADGRRAAGREVYGEQGLPGHAPGLGAISAEPQPQAAAQQKESDSAKTMPAAGQSVRSWREEISDRMTGAMRHASAFWQSNGQWLSLLWLMGALLLAAAQLLQILRWKKRMGLFRKSGKSGGTERTEEGFGRLRVVTVVENERIEEPFVYGMIKPVICLPAGMEEKERDYILCHERMHIRHRDPLLRLLWQIALTVHWFNPLVWLSAFLMRKDAEMFCDESVMKRYGQGARKEYALTLLRFSMKKSGLSLPVAFGESDTESRIHHILKVKKPALAASVLAVCAIILAAVFLLTNPEKTDGEKSLTGDDTQAIASGDAEGSMGTENLAEGESGSGTESQDAPQNREEELLLAAQRWAEAFTARNGEAMLALVADPASMDIYKEEGGSYAVGWSSPWPWNDDFEINYARQQDEVIIHYYANTSDWYELPWRQVVTFVWRDGSYLVQDWETEETAIASAGEFLERLHYESVEEYGYSGSGYRFRNTPLDAFYRASAGEETRAEWLMQQEADGTLYDAWLQPETAAATQLYLDGGRAVEVESPWTDRVCLRWEFADGMTDVICMGQPYEMEGNSVNHAETQASGLWVVMDILEEGVYRQELESGRLRSHYLENPGELTSITRNGAEGIMEIGPDETAVVRLSETENGSVVLYGLVQGESTEGVLLLSEGRCQYFDWYYTSPRMVMPNLIAQDFDGDGQEELAVILLAFTGTGVSVEELVMLERQNDGLWAERRYTEYMEQIGADIVWNYEEAGHRISVTEAGTGRMIGEMDVAELFEEDSVYEAVSIGDIVTFVPEENEMYVQLLTGVRMQGEAVGRYGSYALRARVRYDGEKFSLEDYELIRLEAI